MEANPQEMPLSTDEALTIPPTAEFQSLDLRSIKFNRVSWLIFTLIVSAGFSIASLINFFVNGGPGWVNMAIMGIGFLIAPILFGFGFHWSRWEYERYSWCLDEAGLQIRRGVIWRHQISVPFARVQHADVSQGPLQRRFELVTLTIHTAGTQNASVAIQGLAHETAIKMRDKLVAQRKSGHVV